MGDEVVMEMLSAACYRASKDVTAYCGGADR